jgi:hypothetical protein
MPLVPLNLIWPLAAIIYSRIKKVGEITPKRPALDPPKKQSKAVKVSSPMFKNKGIIKG